MRCNNKAHRAGRFSISGVIILAMMTPWPVLAELEEIVVSARKRDVSLQDAAVAISVTSGEDFQKSNVVKLDNFNGFAPGLVIAKNDGAGRIMAIRGVGWETAQNIASQPSVLTYIDGIYLANPLSAGMDLGELERIEVYRGPQGTEFGQGTTGGAINLISKKPATDKLKGYVQVGYGTYNRTSARGAINIPFSDTAAMRAYIQKYDRDGFAKIKGGALDGYDLDDANSLSTHVSLSAGMGDDVSILAQVFYHNSDQHAAAQKHVDDPNDDPRELTQDFAGIFKLENISASLTMTWETGLGVIVKSLTGYQRLKKRQSVDGDRLSETTYARDINGFGRVDNWDVLPFWDNNSDAFSQEINATYSGERLDWVLGGYYLDHENFNDFFEAANPGPFSATAPLLVNPTPQSLPPFASALVFNEFRTVTREDMAVYAQGTYRFHDGYALTAGVRYQEEEQRDVGAQFYADRFDRSIGNSQLTWKVGLDANLTEDNLIYALVSSGWKNGGTNPGAITNQAIFLQPEFAGEQVTAFEIGSRNTFFAGSVRFNLTAFYYDHEHLQFIFEDPRAFGGGTGTIPEVQEYGIETEISWRINDNWRFDGMLAWQDGQFKSDVFALDIVDFREALGPGVGLLTDPVSSTRSSPVFSSCDPIPAGSLRCELATTTGLKGNEPPKMPNIMARLALRNTHAFANGAVLTSRVEYIHRGRMQARVFNHPLTDAIPGYDVVNLHVGYDMARWPISLSLSVTNVFDEDGINNTFTNPFGTWSTSHEYIPPLEIIGSVRYTWE